jgi:predicted amidohydrolase YtcJ
LNFDPLEFAQWHIRVSALPKAVGRVIDSGYHELVNAHPQGQEARRNKPRLGLGLGVCMPPMMPRALRKVRDNTVAAILVITVRFIGASIRRLLDGGVPVALSTDGVPYSMLWAAWEAIARWDEDGQRQLGESHLTRGEALRMAAQSGHQLTWNEDRFGSLEVGKVADMAVLAEDPLTCDLDRLKDIRIERTFLGGRQVFGPT